MQYGYVFRLGVQFFGILTYTDNGPKVLVRATKENTEEDVCEELSEMFSGNFKPADDGQVLWAYAFIKIEGSAQLLTNFS